MNRTRKWAFVGQEAQRLAGLGLTPYAIAKRLDLSPSTVTRWKHAGKLTNHAVPKVRAARRPSKVPAEWAEQVRREYVLDPTDDQLVTLAQQALELAYNMAEPPATRLAASARFQAIEKRLALALRSSDTDKPQTPEAPTPARPRPRRIGIDPRNVLQAVK